MKHYLQISSVISGLFILTKHFTFRVSTYYQQVKGTLIVDKYTLFVCNYIGHYSLIVYRMFFFATVKYRMGAFLFGRPI